jgi:ribosomal protein S18 acetylase RimI-like enzyme
MPADSAVEIRRIRPDEGLLLRDVRIRSLTDSPAAFGQTTEDAATRPEVDWHRSALRASGGQGRTWLLAEHEGRVVGLVQGRRRPPRTLLVFSMWVDPGSRRLGVGERLIAELETWARHWQASETVLWVLAGNVEAKAFYERIGFHVIDSGSDADSGARYDAIAMRRTIGPVGCSG